MPDSYRCCQALGALAAMALASAPAAAADEVATQPKRPEKRTIPDYDGRPPAPPTFVDGLLWVPRVVLFPVRIVVDYGVRWPLGALVRGAEHSRTLRKIIRFAFLAPKTPTPQIFPVVLYDFGFQPSAGIRLLWTDGFLTPGSRLSIKLGSGGFDLWRTDAAVRVGFGPGFAQLDAGAGQRHDAVFYGIGSDTPAAALARYQDSRRNASLRAGAEAKGIGASVYASAGHHRFDPSNYGGDASIEEQVAAGRIAMLPAGYPDGYNTLRAGGSISLDTRARHERRQESGARFDASAERVWDADDRARAWTRLEAVLGAAVLFDPVGERKLDLRLRAQRVGGGMRADIPFLELATTGGGRDLRGFSSGRLYGDSALALTADYEWPIAAWLDAHAHAGVGNVFGPNFGGVAAGELRGSVGFGVSIAGLSAEREVRLSTAFGTEPFERGLDFSSFRLVLGFVYDY